ncbi:MULTISPECIES: hypothetical protein [unclassified Rathayibacter]|uniref:hypothetical protein n=1 Tax=unclassified Rathayibacter TaxID=2609250 RepID=UPI000CE8AB92|nr:MULTISPECIES: hypothetical protein [unclassified Rathayibacter]PPH27224.1 hypothetical protein C5C37_14180 [Rathayibacter sp. AY1F9]PPH56985.1 hypothetical protein C5C67_00125 [Rathayibacter sp. AY1E1]
MLELGIAEDGAGDAEVYGRAAIVRSGGSAVFLTRATTAGWCARRGARRWRTRPSTASWTGADVRTASALYYAVIVLGLIGFFAVGILGR